LSVPSFFIFSAPARSQATVAGRIGRGCFRMSGAVQRATTVPNSPMEINDGNGFVETILRKLPHKAWEKTRRRGCRTGLCS
jgi:hypothetical protein